MKYKLLRTATADASIRKLILYIAQNFGNETALEKLDQLENQILCLADNPYLGTIPKYPLLARQGYKVLILEKDLVFHINHICLFDYLFISSQMSAKPYFIGSTGILLLW